MLFEKTVTNAIKDRIDLQQIIWTIEGFYFFGLLNFCFHSAPCPC